ncbi:MAG: hypothetical protein ACP5RN_14915 [Armatimonadota bacterium]
MFLRRHPVWALLLAFCWLSASADLDIHRVQDALSQREAQMRQARTEWRVARQLIDVGEPITTQESLSIDSFAQGYRFVFRDQGMRPGTLSTYFDFALPLDTPFGYIVSFRGQTTSPLAPQPKGLLVTTLNFLPPRFLGTIVLTGLNPFRLLQQQTIQTQTVDDRIVVRGKLMQGLFPDDSSDGSDIVLRLDPKRGMAVVEVELLRPGHLPEKAWVKQWKQWNGCWLPQFVSLKASGAESSAEYALEAVRHSTGVSPPWAGEGISDHRLGGRIGESVTYGFTWKLPPLSELRKMQEQQYHPSTKESEKRSALQWLPPFYLSPPACCGTGG